MSTGAVGETTATRCWSVVERAEEVAGQRLLLTQHLHAGVRSGRDDGRVRPQEERGRGERVADDGRVDADVVAAEVPAPDLAGRVAEHPHPVAP